jgi:hypothetical protein
MRSSRKRAMKSPPTSRARKARSPKAGAPPAATKSSPQVRRREKRAHPKVSKGTTLFQTDEGPRAAWPASISKRKKR